MPELYHQSSRKLSVLTGTWKSLTAVLTLNDCKQVLNKGGRKFTDEEIKKIRDFLYLIGEIELEYNNQN